MVAESVISPTSVSTAAVDDRPGVVIVNGSPSNAGLVEELARAMAGTGVTRVTRVGEGLEAEPGAGPDGPHALEQRTYSLPPRLSFAGLVRYFEEELRIADARAVIVLPQPEAGEPDSISRRTCAAIRKACGERAGPNILVEVEDPEAAFEFVGLGVATVFYSGHLRAALLGQACIDLGVFQFVLGLLRGRHRIRTIEVPQSLRAKSFADAAIELEADEHGRAMTIIGVAHRVPVNAEHSGVQVNPGPGAPLADVLGLVALISGDDPPSPREARS